VPFSRRIEEILQQENPVLLIDRNNTDRVSRFYIAINPFVTARVSDLVLTNLYPGILVDNLRGMRLIRVLIIHFFFLSLACSEGHMSIAESSYQRAALQVMHVSIEQYYRVGCEQYRLEVTGHSLSS